MSNFTYYQYLIFWFRNATRYISLFFHNGSEKSMKNLEVLASQYFI